MLGASSAADVEQEMHDLQVLQLAYCYYASAFTTLLPVQQQWLKCTTGHVKVSIAAV